MRNGGVRLTYTLLFNLRERFYSPFHHLCVFTEFTRDSFTIMKSPTHRPVKQ